MINLFEYQNKAAIKDGLDELENFLDEIWNKREKHSFYDENEDDEFESQRFLQFLHKSGEIKSNKYVGVIQYREHKINLLPKIFFDSGREYSVDEINQIQYHILWWLSYCRKIKFPNYQTALGGLKSDFFEVLIYLFSKYTKDLLGNYLYQQYEEMNHDLSFLKGRINTNGYLNENFGSLTFRVDPFQKND